MTVSLSVSEYADILETLPDILLRYDRELTFTYANRAGVEFLGVTREEIIGRSLFPFLTEDGARTIRSDLARISPQAPKIVNTRKHPNPHGDLFILWTTIGLFRGDALTGYQSVGRNITQRRTLRRKLEIKTTELSAAQSELRAVLDAVPARIFYKDDKNNILRLNQAAAESMGMTVEEVEGRNTYDLFGDAAKQYHEDDLKVFRSGKPLRGHIEPYTPQDGTPGWLSTDKLLLDDGSDEPRLLAVATDITALKEQEAVLTSINKNLDDFASMVSHDLQAPLRKIGITTELMQMELGDALPSEVESYVTDIQDGVTHMRQLIRSFLKFMRASASAADLAPTSLNQVFQHVQRDLEDRLDETDGTLILPSRLIGVRGDSALLRQVFANLIENALKYRHPDRPPRIEVSARPDHQYWILEVADNSIGIDPAQAEELFDLFGRAKPHGGVEGSGVGLALCRRIIALHGGAIRLLDSDESGSVFEVTLFRTGNTGDGEPADEQDQIDTSS